LTRPGILVIVGPTGVGKSLLAQGMPATLARRLCTPIRGRYTAGWTSAQPALPRRPGRGAAPHAGCGGPGEPFNAGLPEMALVVPPGHPGRGRPVILEGGTGFYVRPSWDGLFLGPAADPAYREELRGLAGQRGSVYLHALLQGLTPRLRPACTPRYSALIRALEGVPRYG